MRVTPTAHGGPPKPFYMQLYFQVLFGVILGVTLGHFAPEFAVLFKPMGDAFIKIDQPCDLVGKFAGCGHCRSRIPYPTTRGRAPGSGWNQTKAPR